MGVPALSQASGETGQLASAHLLSCALCPQLPRDLPMDVLRPPTTAHWGATGISVRAEIQASQGAHALCPSVREIFPP